MSEASRDSVVKAGTVPNVDNDLRRSRRAAILVTDIVAGILGSGVVVSAYRPSGEFFTQVWKFVFGLIYPPTLIGGAAIGLAVACAEIAFKSPIARAIAFVIWCPLFLACSLMPFGLKTFDPSFYSMVALIGLGIGIAELSDIFVTKSFRTMRWIVISQMSFWLFAVILKLPSREPHEVFSAAMYAAVLCSAHCWATRPQ